MTNPADSRAFADDDAIDLAGLISCLRRGLPKTMALSALGLAVGAIIFVVTGPFLEIQTTSRVAFSFSGFEKGLYPDQSKFQVDDLRAPDNILEALRGMELDTSEKFQSQIRAALTIEGIIPPGVIKERDRLRTAGQTPPPLLPDEYQITLTLPRNFPLTSRQRELLLSRIVSAYRERFVRTYVNTPLDFGNAFQSLNDADFFEYELILNAEVHNIIAYLSQRLNPAERAVGERAPSSSPRSA
jgi:hypothetical protein